jgi:hypothetical protein
MRDAIIIVVVLLLLLLLISVFGGSLRYTPSTETYQSIDDEDEQEQDQDQEQEQEQEQELQMPMHMPMPMPMPQVDTFAEPESEEQSGEISPMMSETFQQAEKSASDVMKKILSTSSKDKKVEPFQSGGMYASF